MDWRCCLYIVYRETVIYISACLKQCINVRNFSPGRGERMASYLLPSGTQVVRAHRVPPQCRRASVCVSVCVHVALPLSSLHSHLYSKKKRKKKPKKQREAWMGGDGCWGLGWQRRSGMLSPTSTVLCPPTLFPAQRSHPSGRCFVVFARMSTCIVRWFARGITGGCQIA